ncbi:plastocyanin/azurin family copper-binding protein [Coraliomargarita sp. SDUM461004]|uniref:Plastocyanin/azurin family copper-binding protein n=1 Tax=Thalassobacterium sedimentorum TaxID=3041258 RepID=A0ABU1AI09_9BACT|nr:plastocyanin/azurin family copper-binding protein [Coraliomargarita sp. SDUM461004]MDQ8194254.1 plastocyanin/azurin family copper-binding protein [Coraliomargarita sp. SDUM461004]
MKYILSFIAITLFFSGCGDSSTEHAHADEAGAIDVMLPENPVSVVDGVTVVEMTGNDRMKFNLESFVVPAGGQVRLTFHNRGKMPKAAMGHNVVFLSADADSGVFATAAAAARDHDYIPVGFDDQIVAHTKLLGPGESDTIEFTVPMQAGDYEYLCSFPAHMFAGMRGVMKVE